MTRYAETIDKIITWAKRDSNVEGAIIIGSHARNELPADQWSDLDLMVLVNDVQILLDENDWLDRFGRVICAFNYVTPLHFVDWDWSFKRALFDDNRDVDFSILPHARLGEVLSVNKDIMSQGYAVIYDSNADLLEAQVRALVGTIEGEEFKLPSEQELSNDVRDLLYHVIWAFKKIKRHELWVAVSTINGHIKDLLLRLVEIYNVSVSHKTAFITYDGRFLENRTEGEMLDKLGHCLSRYDKVDAITALDHVIDTAYCVSKAIFDANGYELDASLFEAIKKLYAEMRSCKKGS
jgi:aminoglycoside 6-adenylyltransferase